MAFSERAPMTASVTGPQDAFAPAWLARRISWGAVLAGVAILLVAQVLLSLLGVSIGAATIEPGAPDNVEASTFSLAAGVWWVITSLLAVFAGAWVAGRLGRATVRLDAALSGLLTWSVATLVLLYLMTTTVGSVVGGAFGALGSTVRAAAEGAGSLGGAAELLPDELQGELDRLFERGQAAAGQATEDVREATGSPNLLAAAQRIMRGVQEGAGEADRAAATRVIAEQAQIPPAEAEQRLERFQASYRETMARVTQEAEASAQLAADTVAQASFWSFVALVLGAIAAAVGGMMGGARAGYPEDSRS